MKSVNWYLAHLYEKGDRLHIFFCVALILPFILAGLTNSNLIRMLAAYGFALSCIYTGRLLCLKFLLQRKWWRLAAFTFLALFVFDIIGLSAYSYFFVDVFAMNHAIESAINIAALVFFLFFCGFFVSLVRSAIREKLNALTLAEEKKSSELSLLRSQVSPHFLFNTMNNLYSLSLSRPLSMPPLLLKLSELLRYSVYEAGLSAVELKDEFEYVRNYIALASVRIADRLDLSIHIDQAPDDTRIAPMLLIIFVENAFKHSGNTFDARIKINIDLRVENGTLLMDVENNFSEGTTGDRYSGFGIANVTRRLELLYPGNYTLEQHAENSIFKVLLQIKLN